MLTELALRIRMLSSKIYMTTRKFPERHCPLRRNRLRVRVHNSSEQHRDVYHGGRNRQGQLLVVKRGILLCESSIC